MAKAPMNKIVVFSQIDSVDLVEMELDNSPPKGNVCRMR